VNNSRPSRKPFTTIHKKIRGAKGGGITSGLKHQRHDVPHRSTPPIKFTVSAQRIDQRATLRWRAADGRNVSGLDGIGQHHPETLMLDRRGDGTIRGTPTAPFSNSAGTQLKQIFVSQDHLAQNGQPIVFSGQQVDSSQTNRRRADQPTVAPIRHPAADARKLGIRARLALTASPNARKICAIAMWLIRRDVGAARVRVRAEGFRGRLWMMPRSVHVREAE